MSETRASVRVRSHVVRARSIESRRMNGSFQSRAARRSKISGAFWSLARGVGFDAVCYAGLVGKDRDPHSWVEIEFDGEPYIFDVETEMSYRLVI